MKEFIENTLHRQIEIKKYKDAKKLPLVLQGNYILFEIEINGQSFILAEPKEDFGLATLRKQQRRMEQLTERYCVLYFSKLNSYPRDKMLEEGIPFVWEGHQIYMPFLGILLNQNETRVLKPCTKLSFLTQKLLLTALYDQWNDVTVTMAAEYLNVSKMSITRCFDEIESLEIPILHKKGRTRKLKYCLDKKEMWELIKPHMREPLLREFYLEQDLSGTLMKSGISALAEYSMLNDNEYKTYAIAKSQLSEFDLKSKKQIPKGEIPGCVVQELGYVINYKNGMVIDPLTVFMLLEDEKEEPRVDKALEEMLEEYVW